MKTFEFRLETLLKIRINRRDELRHEMSDAYRAFAILEQQEAQLEEQKNEVQAEKKELQASGKISVDHVIDNQRFQLLLAAQLRQLGEQKEQVRTEIDVRRSALVEADREVRVLEKLKERKHSRYLQELNREETKQFDEFAVLRNGRTTRVEDP